MHRACLQATLLAISTVAVFALNVEGAQGFLLQSQHGLRGSPTLQAEVRAHAANLAQNSTGQKVVHAVNVSVNSSSQKVRASILKSLSYTACNLPTKTCVVDVPKVTGELGWPIILLFGCSLDIYAVAFFCKAAGAQLVGFTRLPGITKYETGNLAHCQVGGLTLAFSFHPGVSGPPFVKGCDDVLHGSCSGPVTWVASATLIHKSIAGIMATFGRPPTQIVVDSSLWDVASWWLRDGMPPEPYVAPAAHINHWCQASFPALMLAVQSASPTSKVAFRTAPRVEFMAGYGHSMENINRMNACLRGHACCTSLNHSKMIDYNYIVETLVAQQGAPASTYYDDAFHPGVVPSIMYIDWVLQWVRTLL